MITISEELDEEINEIKYLTGKYFILNQNKNLNQLTQKIFIKNIFYYITKNKYVLHVISKYGLIKEEYSSLSEMFECYYNRGYRLEL